jgi:hypothetical protein
MLELAKNSRVPATARNWVAHASGVLAIASSRSRTFPLGFASSRIEISKKRVFQLVA